MDFDLEKLRFDEKGLIPAIVVDHETKQVLTLAYMNRYSSTENRRHCLSRIFRKEFIMLS